MARLYSQRMLNPFHGIVNIVEIEGADAVCRDGANWTLYIQGTKESADLEHGTRGQVALPDIKFGTWSADAGLRRAPVRFVTDYDRLDALGCRLLSLIKGASEKVPFGLQDVYELWLLDAGADALPLALLQSSCNAPESRAAEVSRWTSGQAARRSFRTGAEEAGAAPAADRLTHKINSAAGPGPRTQWFHRQTDGCGLGLSCSQGAPDLIGRVLPPAAFPEVLLRETWEADADLELVQAYLSWQAPWLLALQGLQPDRRRRLERDACKRALLMSELYLTYPLIIDQRALRAARVEARLRAAASEKAEPQGAGALTFFVSGN